MRLRNGTSFILSRQTTSNPVVRPEQRCRRAKQCGRGESGSRDPTPESHGRTGCGDHEERPCSVDQGMSADNWSTPRSPTIRKSNLSRLTATLSPCGTSQCMSSRESRPPQILQSMPSPVVEVGDVPRRARMGILGPQVAEELPDLPGVLSRLVLLSREVHALCNSSCFADLLMPVWRHG